MKEPAVITAKGLTAIAGLLGLEHGIYELLQSPGKPAGILINAVGPPCDPETAWHACLPALTIWPDFRIAGYLTIILSVGLLLLIFLPLQKRWGYFLFILSALLLFSGGGFVAFLQGSFGALILKSTPRPIKKDSKTNSRLAALWPGSLIAYLVCMLSSWLVGQFFGGLPISMSGVVFIVIDLGLPLLAIFSAKALQATALDG